jgi:type I restriction enzyme S subunit
MNNLPKGWIESSIGDVVELAQGLAVNVKTKYILTDKNNGIPLLKINNLLNNTVDQWANPDLAPLKTIVNNEDVIFTRTGQVGEVFTNKYGVLHNNSFKVIPKTKLLDKKFLFWFLKKRTVYKYVHKVAAGSVQLDLNHDAFKTIPISIPPLPEQKAIAKILSSFDEKIELLQQQNETLETIAQTIFKEWFVKGKQNNWNTVKLGDLVKTNVSTINKNSNIEVIKYLDTGSITEGFIEEIQEFNIADAPSRARRIVQHNDVLISTVRPNLKHYGILKQPYDNLVVSTGFCVITCDKIDPHFIYLLLTSNDMTEYLHSIAEGSTSTYPSLKPSDIESIEFKLPPEKKLKSFSEYADSTWNKIRYNQIQIETLTKTRDTLLPKLMSGEIRAEGF